MITGPAADVLLKEYRRCRDWILAALSHSDGYTKQDIIDGLLTAHMQLWWGEHCAVVTRFEIETNAVYVVAIGGDKEGMKEFASKIEPQIIQSAKEHGKTKLYGKGRKGWMKHAQKFGWTVETATPEGVTVGRNL